MKNIVSILLTFVLLQASAQDNTTKSFQKNEIGFSVYGVFFESVNVFSQSHLHHFDFRQQAANGLQYRYRLNEKNAIRASFTFYHTSEKNSPVITYNQFYSYGFHAGYEHAFSTGKWRPYVFGELSYGLSFDKTDYDMTSVVSEYVVYGPTRFTTKERSNQGGVTIGGGLKYFFSPHFFAGIELSGSAMLNRTYHRFYSSDLTNHNWSKGNVFTLAPLRFLSVGVSF